MKRIPIILCALLIFPGCDQRSAKIEELQSRIDSLQSKIDKAYKPGLGEFMSSIQVHHEKLWFAGQYQNWQLADFEIGEIKESLDGIKYYCSDRPEVRSINMIDTAIDSVSNAIQQKDLSSFKSGFTLLTTTCNSCHRATAHAFNVIKNPDIPPFSNQEFKKQ